MADSPIAAIYSVTASQLDELRWFEVRGGRAYDAELRHETRRHRNLLVGRGMLAMFDFSRQMGLTDLGRRTLEHWKDR